VAGRGSRHLLPLWNASASTKDQHRGVVTVLQISRQLGEPHEGIGCHDEARRFDSPETSVFVAIRLMLKHHISGLPVIDNQARLVGILSEGDFLRRAEIETERKRSLWLDALLGPADGAAAYAHSHGLAVKDVMTPDPVTITEDTALDEVVRLMENRNVKRLPVLRDGKVVGIVTRANLMRARAIVRLDRSAGLHHQRVGSEVPRHDPQGHWQSPGDAKPTTARLPGKAVDSLSPESAQASLTDVLSFWAIRGYRSLRLRSLAVFDLVRLGSRASFSFEVAAVPRSFGPP
jgi:CBS domain-containing protein